MYHRQILQPSEASMMGTRNIDFFEREALPETPNAPSKQVAGCAGQ
jgi:hypothetical protein